MTKNITQTLELFPFLYAVIGMRLHSGILSCVHHVPFIPISYGPKTDELVRTLNVEHLSIQSTELNLEIFQKKWSQFIANYPNELSNITEKHNFIRTNLIQSLDSI